MNTKRKGKTRAGIAEIIATLLLILIAVAAAVIVYAYVVGFIGNATGSQGPASASLISVDNACISATNRCSGGTGYYLVIRNVGGNSILSGFAQLYFSNSASGVSAVASCSIPSPSVAPNSMYTCSGGALGFSSGQMVTVKVVNPDGGTSVATVKAIS